MQRERRAACRDAFAPRWKPSILRWRRSAAGAREQELARFREEAESRCEARFAEKPRALQAEGHAGELAWDGDAEFIDAQLRWVAGELAQRDLVLGQLAEVFWTLGGWRRLGFAMESQYARERLGMSLSAVKAKRSLARRTRELPHLADAMKARDLGYEAARLVASVASRDTVESWVERARERTVKHLAKKWMRRRCWGAWESMKPWRRPR